MAEYFNIPDDVHHDIKLTMQMLKRCDIVIVEEITDRKEVVEAYIEAITSKKEIWYKSKYIRHDGKRKKTKPTIRQKSKSLHC